MACTHTGAGSACPLTLAPQSLTTATAFNLCDVVTNSLAALAVRHYACPRLLLLINYNICISFLLPTALRDWYRSFVCLSVCLFVSTLSFELDSFCMSMGHDPNSPEIESQGHRSRSMVSVRVEYCLTAVIIGFNVTSSAAC